jgi:hypothetical protein
MVMINKSVHKENIKSSQDQVDFARFRGESGITEKEAYGSADEFYIDGRLQGTEDDMTRAEVEGLEMEYIDLRRDEQLAEIRERLGVVKPDQAWEQEFNRATVSGEDYASDVGLYPGGKPPPTNGANGAVTKAQTDVKAAVEKDTSTGARSPHGPYADVEPEDFPKAVWNETDPKKWPLGMSKNGIRLDEGGDEYRAGEWEQMAALYGGSTREHAGHADTLPVSPGVTPIARGDDELRGGAGDDTLSGGDDWRAAIDPNVFPAAAKDDDWRAAIDPKVFAAAAKDDDWRAAIDPKVFAAAAVPQLGRQDDWRADVGPEVFAAAAMSKDTSRFSNAARRVSQGTKDAAKQASAPINITDNSSTTNMQGGGGGSAASSSPAVARPRIETSSDGMYGIY